jgi:transposase
MFGRWTLYDVGRSVTDIVREMGLPRERINRWARLTASPERNPMAPKASSPALFRDYLSRRWAEGCTQGRRLFTEIQRLGYSGC